MYRWFWKCGRLFFCGQITLGAISSNILRWPRLFWPLNCPELSEKQLRGQIFQSAARDNLGVKKVEAPSKYPVKWPIKKSTQKQNIFSQIFKISGTLVMLSPIATRARFWKPFKESRNWFPARRANTTTLFVALTLILSWLTWCKRTASWAGDVTPVDPGLLTW